MGKFIRKLIAFLRGTFTAECPRCHHSFYGHHSHGLQVKIDNKHYRILCGKCMGEPKLLK